MGGRGQMSAGASHDADSAVFNKIVITALKFTPVVVAHHLPYKTLPNGKLCVLSLPVSPHI